MAVRITVVYDNELVQEDLRSGWGFSALVDQDVLFDTGADADSLLANLDGLGVDPSELDTVVLSHGHADHTGGLSGLISKTENLRILVPSRRLAKSLRQSVPESIEIRVSADATLVRPEVTTTGALGDSIREQGLVCQTERGAYLITGCAHPGLDALLDAARGLADIVGVIGGFHDFSRLEALRDLDLVSPCHCTRRKREIAERFPSSCVRCGAGLVVEEGTIGR